METGNKGGGAFRRKIMVLVLGSPDKLVKRELSQVHYLEGAALVKKVFTEHLKVSITGQPAKD